MKLFALIFFFHTDHFATLVIAAFRAYSMGHAHFATIAALNQIIGDQRILRTATITPSFG